MYQNLCILHINVKDPAVSETLHESMIVFRSFLYEFRRTYKNVKDQLIYAATMTAKENTKLEIIP